MKSSYYANIFSRVIRNLAPALQLAHFPAFLFRICVHSQENESSRWRHNHNIYTVTICSEEEEKLHSRKMVLGDQPLRINAFEKGNFNFTEFQD